MSRIRLSYWPILLLALWSCRKDVENFEPYAPSAQDLSTLLAAEIPGPTTHTVFTLQFLNEDKILETPSGLRIFLVDTDHLFAQKSTGNPVLTSTCQDLKVDVTEVLDKKDIVARSLNTVGDNGQLFESGGMVNVTVTCNGELLALLPDRKLKIQVPNASPQTGFFVFDEVKDGNGNFSKWTQSGQEVFEADWLNNTGTTQHGYELLVQNLGWSAAGKPVTDPNSMFCVTLPSGFADQNTLAYIVFSHQQIVAPLEYTLAQGKFCYPNAPAGYQVQLMAVSKLGTQYWLGKGQTEIGTNATVPLGTQQMTEEAVLNFVKSL